MGLEIRQLVEFPEFHAFLQKVIEPTLVQWGFKEVKRRGYRGGPPVDLLQEYTKRRTKSTHFGLVFAISGKVDDLRHSNCTVWLIVEKKVKNTKDDVKQTSTMLPKLAEQRPDVKAHFTNHGWSIGTVLSQYETNTPIELLEVLKELGLPWLESQVDDK